MQTNSPTPQHNEADSQPLRVDHQALTDKTARLGQHVETAIGSGYVAAIADNGVVVKIVESDGLMLSKPEAGFLTFEGCAVEATGKPDVDPATLAGVLRIAG